MSVEPEFHRSIDPKVAARKQLRFMQWFTPILAVALIIVLIAIGRQILLAFMLPALVAVFGLIHAILTKTLKSEGEQMWVVEKGRVIYESPAWGHGNAFNIALEDIVSLQPDEGFAYCHTLDGKKHMFDIQPNEGHEFYKYLKKIIEQKPKQSI